MFPNRFSVWLHDTPAEDLSARRIRSSSSGCIWIQEAVARAENLLRDHPGWSPEAVGRAMGAGTGEETVRLPEPVPVHICCMTAWSEEAGTMEFRTDVYSRDQALEGALGEGPPDPAEQLGLPAGPVGTPGSRVGGS